MNSNDDNKVMADALDADMAALLAKHHASATVPAALKLRMRTAVLEKVAAESACLTPGFQTIRAAEGEWIHAVPGAAIKILHHSADSPVVTYLARLEPGLKCRGIRTPMTKSALCSKAKCGWGSCTSKPVITILPPRACCTANCAQKRARWCSRKECCRCKAGQACGKPCPTNDVSPSG